MCIRDRIYAEEGYGSRCPEGGCHGNEAMGIYAGGDEEEGRKEEKKEVGLSFEI